VFRDWAASLPKEIEVCPVCLPGEDLREDCVTNIHELVPAMADGLSPYFDKPFAMFGHSMGAIIAFELLRLLQQQHRAEALHLFVSARTAPGVARKEEPFYNLPHAELIDKLKQLNGTPREILDNKDILELMLPRVRADFQLNETYLYEAGEPLRCPITAYAGAEDCHASAEDMREWERQTAANFQFQVMPGDHFFLQTERTTLLQSISAALSSHIVSSH
jgi:surfactin synthase thioesterase subunit